MKLISQNAKIAQALAPNADLFAGDPSTDVFSLGEYRNICFVLSIGENASSGSAVVTVDSCDNTTPDTATAVAFKYAESTSTDDFGELTNSDSAGFTTSATADNMYLIEVDAADLSGTDEFVQLTLTESVAQAVDAGVTAVLYNPRYAAAADEMPTAIA